VDTERIGAHGSSQGGALSIVVAALRPEAIACCAAGAPYLCGIATAPRLTHSYPYEEINEYLRIHPHHADALTRAVAYYDGLNFAPMISCPTMVYIGLADNICPPETGAALYEGLSGPKRLVTSEGCAHDAGAHWVTDQVVEFLGDHLRPAGDSEPSRANGPGR
jgi:cephalosporin-C deacetylase